MDRQNPIFNIFFTIVLIIGWTGILFATFLLWLISDVFRFLGNGILVYIFVFIYAAAFVLPIIFRKRISKYLPLPLAFIVFAIFSAMIVGCIFVGARSYISVFSREKWDNNQRLRVYMIDDLENKHKIVGKTKEEIINLLGEPGCIYDDERKIYEYYVGESIIDPYGYRIEFENNIAKDTKMVEY